MVSIFQHYPPQIIFSLPVSLPVFFPLSQIVAVLLSLTSSAISAWRYPFYDPSSRHGYPLLPFYDQHFPAPWPYQGPYYPEDLPEFRVFPCSPRPFPYYPISVVDREFEHENKMEFRDDTDNDESFDTADDLPDNRLIHFQTNTPYRRFNNFIRTLDNLRSAFKAKRRWNFKIRRNKNGLVFETIQEPITVEEENHQANNYDYYYINN